MHRLHDMHALWMKLVHVVLNQSNKFVFSVGTVSTLPENHSTLSLPLNTAWRYGSDSPLPSTALASNRSTTYWNKKQIYVIKPKREREKKLNQAYKHIEKQDSKKQLNFRIPGHLLASHWIRIECSLQAHNTNVIFSSTLQTYKEIYQKQHSTWKQLTVK